MAIAAGRLRHRVRIEERNIVDNGNGGRAAPTGGPKWRTVADRVPAEVVAVKGDTALEHLVARKSTLWRVALRRRPGLTTDMGLTWGDIPMLIRAIVPTDAGDGVVLTCESGVPR